MGESAVEVDAVMVETATGERDGEYDEKGDGEKRRGSGSVVAGPEAEG